MEGTILTVMRDTARAVSGAHIEDIAPLTEHMLDRARDSLERTPELLPVLSAAGVVDAGAKGFVSLLEGVVMFLRGDPLTTESGEEFTAGPPGVASIEYPERVERYRFCTEALVRGNDLPDQAEVRGSLRARGDSTEPVNDNGTLYGIN